MDAEYPASILQEMVCGTGYFVRKGCAGLDFLDLEESVGRL